jgi:hypothetical protein
MRIRRRGVLALVVVMAVVGGSLYLWRAVLDHDEPLGASAVEARAGAPTWGTPQKKPQAKKVDAEERDDLLARALVWRQPAQPIEQVSFARDSAADFLRCRFHVTELGGTTPKFDCHRETGELIRIKYGRTGEVPGEVATTRLLRAMGFGADRVEYVEKLHCYGCPEEPFSVMKAVEITQAQQIYKRLMLSYDDFEEFAWAAVERKYDGREIETEQIEGWGMFELDKVDPARGGAPRAQVDALRLLAVFLAHWDNKTENQRLVCVSQDDWKKGERCEKPFLLLQDVGSTFGPTKVDLEKWQQAPIWEDRVSCLTSMRELPFNGATFGQARISDEGRRFLAGMLTRFTDRQLTDLFSTSRFDDPLGLFRRRSPIAEWVRVFKERARQIADGPPCPSATTQASDAGAAHLSPRSRPRGK